jgi:hypothetical protein
MLNNRACTRKLHLSIVIAALVTSRTSIPQPSELTKAFCTCGRPAGQESPAVKQQSREKRPRACGASRWVVDLWHMHRAMLHSMPTRMHDIPTSLAYSYRGHSTLAIPPTWGHPRSGLNPCYSPGARLRAPSNKEAPTWGRLMAVVLQTSKLHYIPTTAPGATLGLGALAMVEAARLKPSTAQPAPAHTGNDHYLHSYRRHPLGAMTGPSYLTEGEGSCVWAVPAAFTPHRALLPPHTTPIQLS